MVEWPLRLRTRFACGKSARLKTHTGAVLLSSFTTLSPADVDFVAVMTDVHIWLLQIIGEVVPRY